MKRENGTGTVIKLSGNRRKPYAARLTVGFSEKGYPIYKYLSYHATKREALKALDEYTRNPYDLNSLSFSEVFEKWLENKDVDFKQKRAYRHYFSLFPDRIKKMKMAEISVPVLQHFADDFKASKSQIRLLGLVLSGTFKYAAKHGIIPLQNEGIYRLVDFDAKIETNGVKRVPFSRLELDRIWELWNDEQNFVAQICLFLAYTGMRYDEFANIKPEDIRENYIQINKSKTVAGIRIVPLSDKAKKLLPEPISYFRYVKLFKVMMSDFEMDHHVYDTRHTFISLMTEAGCDKRILKKIVGHSTDDVTEDFYTHISLEKMLEEVNKI